MPYPSTNNRRTFSAVLTLLVTILVLCGCQVEPRDFHAPVALPDHTPGTTPGTESASENSLPAQWWLAFDDPQLNRLVELALADNFDIKIAWDRLAKSQAVARQAGADLYPAIDLDAAVRHENGELLGSEVDTWRYTLGINAQYEIDFWGRVRAGYHAARLDAQALREDVSVAAITLSANIASKYYELAEARQQVRVLQNQIETNNAVMEILDLQFRQGQAQAADILRQQNLIESNKGSLILKQRDETIVRYQLAVLLGLPPTAELPVDEPRLVDLPSLPATGLPVQILQRRPDVRAAYRAVQAADLRLAQAIAAQYPRFSISADVDTLHGQRNDLFNNWLVTLAGNLAQPLFDGDLRKAEVQRNQAAISEAINQYGRTLLESLQEVEQAVERERRQTQYIASLARQLETSNSVIERTRDSYLNGQLNYIDVLAALTSQQNLERQYVTARRQRIDYRIDLCKAIAGSWQLQAPGLTELKVARSSQLSPDQPAQP